MPMLALGTGGQHTPAELLSTLQSAFSLGYTHIETAEAYTSALDPVVQFLRSKPRSSYFLTSKINPASPGSRVRACKEDGAGCFAEITSAIDEHIKKLGVDYVNLLLLHKTPSLKERERSNERKVFSHCAKIREQWRALEVAHRDRKVARAIGVSNYCSGCMRCLLNISTVTPAVWQEMHHVGMGRNPFGYPSWAARLGIVYQAYSVLGGASSQFEAITKSPTVRRIAEKHGTSTAEVAIQWVAMQDLPVVVLSGSSKHLASNIDAVVGSSWRLSAAEMGELSSLSEPAGRPSHWGLCDDVQAPKWSAAWASEEVLRRLGSEFTCKAICDDKRNYHKSMDEIKGMADKCRDCGDDSPWRWRMKRPEYAAAGGKGGGQTKPTAVVTGGGGVGGAKRVGGGGGGGAHASHEGWSGIAAALTEANAAAAKLAAKTWQLEDGHLRASDQRAATAAHRSALALAHSIEALGLSDLQTKALS